MKKFYSLMLLTLLSLAGLSANAFKLTVKADPTIVDNIQVDKGTTGFADKEATLLDFSLEGVENDFDVTGWGSFIYFYVALKADYAGQAYNSTIIKSDGTGLKTVHNKKTVNTYALCMPWKTFDGGTFEVALVPEEPKAFTAEITGDLSMFTMSINQVAQTLTTGTNNLKCTSQGYVSIMTTDEYPLYEVKLNDAVKSPAANDTGVYSYTWSCNEIKEGDKIYINTVWPDEPSIVKVLSNDWGYIKTVTINGEDKNDEAALTAGVEAKLGQILKIEANKNDYKLNSVTINSKPASFAGQLNKVLDMNYTIEFDVTKLERDKECFIEFAQDVQGGYTTALGTYTTISSGSKVLVKYADEELPIVILASTTSSEEDLRVIHVYRNGQLFGGGANVRLTADDVADGDVFKVELANPSFNINVTGAEYINATLYGNEITLKNGDNKFEYDAAAEDYTLKFWAVGDGYIKKATVTGIGGEILPGGDDVYIYDPFTFDNIEIVAENKYVTINVNDAEGLMYGVVIINEEDGYIFVENGENKVDLTQFEGGLLYYQFLPNIEKSYKAVKVLFNGEDVTESGLDYDMGCYMLQPANPGDVLDIEVAQVERNDLMVLYINGIENVTNPYVYNSWASVDLGGELAEGYQQVIFDQAFDCPLMFGYEILASGMQTYVYYNNDPILYDWGYNLPAENYGVTKAYFAAEEPGVVSDFIEVRGSANAPKILVDYVADGYVMPILRGMDTMYSHTELPGTFAVLEAPEGDKYNEVYINGELVLPDESGAYIYTMTADQDILIYANDETGISTIGVDAD
ncbi:MAG: hypothetical protein HUK14_08645, partial [Muribaculaceae bacterium]|nr:hypothetical protein [Muribaculaceae bacterium]